MYVFFLKKKNLIGKMTLLCQIVKNFFFIEKLAMNFINNRSIIQYVQFRLYSKSISLYSINSLA